MKIDLEKIKKLDIEDDDILIIEPPKNTGKKGREAEIEFSEWMNKKFNITIIYVPDIDKIGVLKFKDKRFNKLNNKSNDRRKKSTRP